MNNGNKSNSKMFNLFSNIYHLDLKLYYSFILYQSNRLATLCDTPFKIVFYHKIDVGFVFYLLIRKTILYIHFTQKPKLLCLSKKD